MSWFKKWCDEYDLKKESKTQEPPVGPLSLLIGMVVVVAGLAGFICYEAFVILTIWNWFLAPLVGFSLTLVSAIALDMLVGVMTAHVRSRKASTYETYYRLGQMLFINTTALLVAVVLHMFFV